jgi:hypothetical protein
MKAWCSLAKNLVQLAPARRRGAYLTILSIRAVKSVAAARALPAHFAAHG